MEFSFFIFFSLGMLTFPIEILCHPFFCHSNLFQHVSSIQVSYIPIMSNSLIYFQNCASLSSNPATFQKLILIFLASSFSLSQYLLYFQLHFAVLLPFLSHQLYMPKRSYHLDASMFDSLNFLIIIYTQKYNSNKNMQ